MLTNKQRNFLRSMANPIDSIFQIGKGGINENLVKQLNDALEARELIKINVLPNSDADTRDLSRKLAVSLLAEEVQVIGNRFILYRESQKDPKIKLPL